MVLFIWIAKNEPFQCSTHFSFLNTKPMINNIEKYTNQADIGIFKF